MARKLPIVDSYERPDLCAPCGGACCRTGPGIASPEEMGAPDEQAMRARVRELLATGRWAVDWWEGDPRPGAEPDADARGYYLRPSVVGSEGLTFDPSYGGRCTFHTDAGCSIFDERPDGCRGLRPKEGAADCVPVRGSKRDSAIAWWPYRELLEEIGVAVEETRGMSISS